MREANHILGGAGEKSSNAHLVKTIPDQMTGVILQAPGQLVVSKVPVPDLEPGDLLVQVECATTCGTDLKAFLRGHPQIPMPGLFGHEYSGIVAATGDGACFKVGQAIMGVHSAPCGTCFWCHRGQENLCESIMETKVLGTFAEYIRVPARIAQKNVYAKPAEISFGLASLLEPFSCVAQAIEELKLALNAPKGLHENLSVLIIGPGAIGLLFVAALKNLGVEEIVLAGRNPLRLEVGEQLGAKPQMMKDIPNPSGRGFDIVIECTGQPEIWQTSIDHVRRGGTLVLFGGCPSDSMVTFATKRVHYDQISILSPFHFGTGAVKLARQWIVESKSDLNLLLSGSRNLDMTAQVFEDLKFGKGIKYCIQP
jgi:L-iditol 2-dehydrogenase